MLAYRTPCDGQERWGLSLIRASFYVHVHVMFATFLCYIMVARARGRLCVYTWHYIHGDSTLSRKFCALFLYPAHVCLQGKMKHCALMDWFNVLIHVCARDNDLA